MTVRPARRPSHSGPAPQPRPLTAPRPLTTTRRRPEPAIWSLMRPARRRLGAGLDELGQARDRGEDLAPQLLALDLDAELPLQGDDQLEGIDGVEPQTFAEQRGLVLDHFGFDPFEMEAIHDQTLHPVRSGNGA